MKKTVHIGALALVALLALGVVDGSASAQTTGSLDITSVLQNIVTMFTGTAAKLLATIAIILTGIAWMFGLFDLRKVGYVVLGIGLLFGATQIVGLITGSGS